MSHEGDACHVGTYKILKTVLHAGLIYLVWCLAMKDVTVRTECRLK